MTKIALNNRFFESIRNGNKKSTIRLGKRDYTLGPCILYSESFTEDLEFEELEVTITDVYFKYVYDLTSWDAVDDGFSNLEELLSTLESFYPDMKPNDIVTKVIFEL